VKFGYIKKQNKKREREEQEKPKIETNKDGVDTSPQPSSQGI